MSKVNYEIAFANARKMLYDGFYDSDYIIAWMDSVAAGKQNPASRMTPEAQRHFDMMMNATD
jgi:hypothetical protein